MESRRWDERYAQPGFAYGIEPNDFLAAVADRIPPGPVLSLGEGEGRNAAFLAGLGHEVLAVDLSTVGLDKARRLAHARGLIVQTRQADLGDFPIEPGAWAGIVSIFCHLPPAIRAPCMRPLSGVCGLAGCSSWRRIRLGSSAGGRVARRPPR